MIYQNVFFINMQTILLFLFLIRYLSHLPYWAVPIIRKTIGEDAVLQYTVMVLSKCSGCSTLYVTHNSKLSLGLTGFLKYSAEVQPHEVTTSCITNGLSPVFFNTKTAFCSFRQSNLPNGTNVLPISALVLVTLLSSFRPFFSP